MQTQKWVNLGLLISALAIFLFFNQLLAAVWDWGHFQVPAEWPVQPSQIISVGIAAIAVFGVRKSQGSNTFLNEVVMELSRVTWPQRKETIASAGVVVILLAFASLILFLIDNLWGTVIRGILSL